MLRGRFFDKISKFSNWGLVVAGIFLLVFQLNSFFTDHDHHHEHNEPAKHNHTH